MFTGEPDGAAAEASLLSEHLSSLGSRNVLRLEGDVGRALRRLKQETGNNKEVPKNAY